MLAATTESARARFPSGTIFTAIGGAIAQKTECAQATPIRLAISIQYWVENALPTWLTAKRSKTPRRSFRYAIREQSTMSGSDISATTQA